MKKLLNRFKRNLLSNLIILAISFLVGISFFFIYIFLIDKPNFKAMCDASFIIAAFFLTIGLITIINRLGYFDSFGYGFAMMGTIFFRPVRFQKKYEDLVDYKQQQYDKRKDKSFYFISFIIVGLLFLIAAIVFLILFKTSFDSLM